MAKNDYLLPDSSENMDIHRQVKLFDDAFRRDEAHAAICNYRGHQTPQNY